MNKTDYNALPINLKARTDKYLNAAKELTEEWFGMDNGIDIHVLTVQLAAAMMNMESSQIIASEISALNKRINKVLPAD